jgi:hypothetical protein
MCRRDVAAKYCYEVLKCRKTNTVRKVVGAALYC